jgi:hypothetical protein
MDTNAVIIVLAEPFGLDDRRDILAEIVLQEVPQNFLPARLRVLFPSLRYRLSAQWQAVLTSPHSGRDDDQARRTTPARFPLPHGEAAPWPADAEPSVAVARKLAVITHRMWVFGSEFKTGVERPGLATA